MSGQSSIDHQIAEIATAHHGVVTRRWLLAAGITDDDISYRLGTGTLFRVHPGIYRVGHEAPSHLATYLAATAACGTTAVLCGEAAGWLLGLLRRKEPPPAQVATVTDRKVKGVDSRRLCLAKPDIWEVDGIRVTSPARTLLDLAAILDGDELARAAHEAGVKHKTTPRQVKAAMSRRKRAPGAAKLRAIMDGDVKVVLSKLEARFLALVKAEGLPLPDTNKRVGGRRVDFHWQREHITVEVDGYRYHRSRHTWEKDYERALEARARGEEFRRYSYADVTQRGTLVRKDLRSLFKR